MCVCVCLRILSDLVHREQIYLLQTNRQRGIGFKAMGVTLDTPLLVRLAAALGGLIFPLFIFLLHEARYVAWNGWPVGQTTPPVQWTAPYHNNGCE